MTRRGAKRKARGYTPGHKPVNAPTEDKDFGTVEMQAQRARCVGEAYIRAWDGSLLHAWFLRNDIERHQYEAGKKWSSLIQRYRSMICAPNPNQGPGTRRPSREVDPEEFEKVTRAYQSAYECMDNKQHRAVNQLLHDNVEVRMVKLAERGLSLLARHWGL